jgi:pyruvate-formate lyase-activating enzyme
MGKNCCRTNGSKPKRQEQEVMSFGFEEDRFYIDVKPLAREIKDPITEFNLRASSLGSMYDNIWLSFSGGSDSQITMLAFKEQGIPFKCAFMYLPKYNDNEYEQVKVLTKKHLQEACMLMHM